MKSDAILVTLLFGGLLIGAIVGLAFGLIQAAALDRYRQLQKIGRLRSAVTIIPGSMRRIALLLVALVSIQLAFPEFFQKEGMPWVVTAGVVLGYGGALLRQTARRQTGNM